MADITIIDNEYITMQYMEDLGTLYHVIHQPISGQPLRDALLTGLNTLQDHGASKWVSDDRKNGPMSDEDRAWGEVNVNQRADEAGWKYWALIVPEQIVAAGSMAPIMEANFERGLRMMVFSNTDEAFDWISSFDD